MNMFISMLGAWDFLNPLTYIMDIFNLIPKLVYFLSATAMGLLDIAQMLIRKLAGLDVHYNAQGDAQSGDITLSFLQGIFGSDPNFAALRNAFWSLIILAIILLVVATIISVIRQEYMPGQEESREKPSNTRKHVINRAFKSMFMFLIVPVSVFFGLMFSDAILRAMDSITSGVGSSAFTTSQGVAVEDGDGNTTITYPTDRLVAEAVGDGQGTSYVYYDFFSLGLPTTSTPFSGFAFKTAGFMANRVRIGKEYKLNDETKTFDELITMGDVSNFGIFNMASTKEEMALMIDDAFAGNVKLQNPQHLSYESAANSDIKNPMLFLNIRVERFTKYNVALVWYYYDLWQYNFVIAAAFLIVSLKIIIKIIMGLMKRIIELVALFIISPPIIALMPLDGGKSFGQWKNSFLSKALGVFGAIIGMNILFLLLPYINQIKFLSENTRFSTTVSVFGEEVYLNAAKMVNMVISSLFIITGLVVVDGLIALVSTVIGSDDVAKEGGELTEKVGDTLQAGLNKTGSMAGIALAPLRMARDGVNVLGRKITGNKDFKIGKSLSKWVRPKPTLSAKQEKAIEAGQSKLWDEGGGEAAYDKYIQGQQAYKKQLRESFKDRKDKDASYDDWLASDEGKNAEALAFSSASIEEGVQSKDRFLARSGGAGKKAYEKELSAEIKKQESQLPVKDGFLKRTGAKLLKSKTFKQFSSYSSHVMSAVEEAAGRKGKPGYIKSMSLSFQGKSEKEKEKDKKIEDYKKEQMRKEEYDKRHGRDGKGGMSDSDIKALVKKENVKLQTKLEDEFKKEMEQRIERETQDLKGQITKQTEEISNLKKKK